MPAAEWLRTLKMGSLARAELARQELAEAPELLARFMDWAQSSDFPFDGCLAKTISQLPRDLHWRWDDARRASIRPEPRLVGNRWDALLTAMVEHVAGSHGDPCPDWVHRPQRFLESPWFISPHWDIVSGHWIGAPAAFIRHNAFPDPAELDERGGDREAWMPGVPPSREKPLPCRDRDLQRFAEKLAGAGVAAKILLAGNGMFPLVYRRPLASDIPCLCKSRLPAADLLSKLAAATASERGLPPDWLLHYARQRPPRPGTPLPVFCSKPSLCMTGCKPSLPLFMMLLSRRAEDAANIRSLLEACNMHSETEALRKARRAIPSASENPD